MYRKEVWALLLMMAEELGWLGGREGSTYHAPYISGAVRGAPCYTAPLCSLQCHCVSFDLLYSNYFNNGGARGEEGGGA